MKNHAISCHAAGTFGIILAAMAGLILLGCELSVNNTLNTPDDLFPPRKARALF
jgi:hypothetical protein